MRCIGSAYVYVRSICIPSGLLAQCILMDVPHSARIYCTYATTPTAMRMHLRGAAGEHKVVD